MNNYLQIDASVLSNTIFDGMSHQSGNTEYDRVSKMSGENQCWKQLKHLDTTAESTNGIRCPIKQIYTSVMCRPFQE